MVGVSHCCLLSREVYQGILLLHSLTSAEFCMVLCISDLAPFIYSSGRVGLRPALQLTLATDESAWWCWVLAPRVTMLALFFVCITAINSIWDEEPKSEPKLMLEAPVSAGCCSSACPCFIS